MHVQRGFQVDRVLTATIDLPSNEYPHRVDLYTRMLTKLRTLPGVENAAMVSVVLPLDGDFWIDMARVSGDTRSFFQMPTEHWRWISPGYFQALHLPLVEGHFSTTMNMAKMMQLSRR